MKESIISNVKLQSNLAISIALFLILISIQLYGQEKGMEKARSTDIEEVFDRTWKWVSTLTPVQSIKASDPERYTVQFLKDGKVRIRFDCNKGGGNYTISQGNLTFGPLISTRMACPEDTQDALFVKDLQRVSSFFIEDGDLYLELSYDSGTMRFQNAESYDINPTDPADAVYTIENQKVQLHQGKNSQPAAPGSDITIESSIAGSPQYGDLNDDNISDAVIFLRRNSGGSGEFFYVAAALHNTAGWQGTNAILLGDRIIPHSIEINDGIVTVNYLDRRRDEPMSAPAAMEMKRMFFVHQGQLMDYDR